jgi:hypothetical protein
MRGGEEGQKAISRSRRGCSGRLEKHSWTEMMKVSERRLRKNCQIVYYRETRGNQEQKRAFGVL